MSRYLRFVPLVVLLLFVAVVAWRLVMPEDTKIRSRMTGQPVPAFALAAATDGVPGLSSKDLATGQPRLVNVFASWCVPCAAEAPQLMALKQAGVEIDGVAIRDARSDVDRFLQRYGNPYSRIGLDARSSVQIAIGSSGVPESFIIDGKGRIAYQHVGDIRADDIPMILQRLEAAR